MLRHRTGHNKLDLQSVNYNNQSGSFKICIYIRGSPCWQEWKLRTDCNLASPFSSKNWAGRLLAGEWKGITVGQLNRIPGGSLSGRWGTIWLTWLLKPVSLQSINIGNCLGELLMLRIPWQLNAHFIPDVTRDVNCLKVFMLRPSSSGLASLRIDWNRFEWYWPSGMLPVTTEIN